jgi:hypothetical protein
LAADISEFYHSIYTHSISWALHTKLFAKSNQKAKVVGNLLDKATQNGQHGQTVGIPIGPDTSLVASACPRSRRSRRFWLSASKCLFSSSQLDARGIGTMKFRRA